ncbi:reverse transcriptase domain-containing protein [Tanacetum coccineum]
MARTPLNENCSAVILNKLPKKLGDPGRFLIPCEFSGINTCNALADLGASINLMPYFRPERTLSSDLTTNLHDAKATDRSITEPIGIAKDVRLMVGKFQFPADFVMFTKVKHTLPSFGKEPITFNLDQTSRYTANYNHMTANRIDVIELASEEYSQEVLAHIKPPEVELKELPPHLEYAFLEGDDKLPVIIAKDLKDEEKAALLKVLKSHK